MQDSIIAIVQLDHYTDIIYDSCAWLEAASLAYCGLLDLQPKHVLLTNAQQCTLLQLETDVAAGDLLPAGLPQTQDGRIGPLTVAYLQLSVVKKES